jgi:hypothetical protein
MEQQSPYEVGVVTIDSHTPPPCASCKGAVTIDNEHPDLDRCTACNLPRVRSQAKPAAAHPLDAVRALVAPYEARMLPCPFCGHAACLHWNEKQTYFWPGCACNDCDSNIDRWMTPEDSVTAWNTRAATTRREPLRVLFDEMIGHILEDHDAFQGIASGRLAATVNRGRDTWQVARGWQRRLDVLLMGKG